MRPVASGLAALQTASVRIPAKQRLTFRDIRLRFNQLTDSTLAGLTTSLISYWKLDEASGQRNDAHGTNHLTDNNTVTQAAGKLNYAAQFTAPNTEFLSIADNPALSTGDIDFLFACFVNFDSIAASRVIAGKWDGPSNQREWQTYYSTGTNTLVFEVSPDGSLGAIVRVDSGVTPVVGTWYYIVVWHDSIANTINIQVNNASVVSLTHSLGVFEGTSPFFLGISNGAAGSPMYGRIDGAGFWKRVLTAAERTALYNAGAGLDYPFTSNDPFNFNTDTPVHSTRAFCPLDHFNNGSEIISALGYNDTLYWRRVTTPGTLSQWNTWVQIPGAACKSGSRPSIFHNANEKYVWTYDGSYIKCWITTDNVNWVISGTFAFAPAGYDQIVGLACASIYDCFACAIDSTGPVQKLSIWHISRYFGTVTQWTNTVISAAFSYPAATFFDAVQLDKDQFIVFYQEADNGPTMACLFTDGTWSAPSPVVPMDILGTASFRIHGALVIKGVIWAIGRITRPGSTTGYDVSFDAAVRSVDGINWTFERNVFVTSAEIRGTMMLAADGYVYYPGLKTIYRAPSSYLIDPAGDPAAAKTTITQVGDGEIDVAPGDGSASQMSAGLSTSTSHGLFVGDSIVKGGSLVFCELGFDAAEKVHKTWPSTPSSAWRWNDGSYWPDPAPGDTGLYQLIDVFDVDAIESMNKDGERSVQMMARGAVGKALNATTLQDYQYLSQVKWTDDFDAIDHIVRVSGAFSAAAGELIAADTSYTNLCWFTGPEGISSGLYWPVAQVQFKFVTSASGKSAGIVLCGKDSDNYWYAKVDSGAVYLIERAAGVETTIQQQTGLTFSADTWYWVKATYRGGRFMVYTRADGSADWTLRLDYTHATANLPAFGRREGFIGVRADATANTVKFRNAFVWNEGVDHTTDSLLRAIATLAGVMTFTRDFAIASTNQASGWWSTSQFANLDLYFQIPGDVEAGLVDNSWFIAFRSTTNVWSTSNGYAIRIRRDSSNQWIVTLVRRDGTVYDSSTDDIERVILPYIRRGYGMLQARLVVVDKWITLYLNGFPVANFWNSAVTAAGYVGIFADVSAQSLQNIYMPELYEWRAAHVMEMDSTYLSGLTSAVNGRFVQLFGDGLSLRYSKFASRSSLGTLASGVEISKVRQDDAQRAALVRATGAEIIESLDAVIARDYGMLFAQIQNTAGNLAADLLSAAQRALQTAKEDADQIDVDGRPLLGAQNEDKITVNYTAPDGSYTVNDIFVVDELSYTFGPGELWMSFHGRKNYGG